MIDHGFHVAAIPMSDYNVSMIKCSSVILLACFLVAGCETSSTSSDNHHDRISREIEQARAEAERSGALAGNIRITVNMLSTSVNDYFAIDSLLQYTDKNVVVTKAPEVYGRSGLQVGVAGENFRARLDITKKTLKSSEETELFLVLADGSTGYISIGQEIAVPRFFYSGRWYSAVEYDFRRAGRSIKVTARRLGSGLIEMELTPVFSRFLNNGGDLELVELSTRVTAAPGQTLVIGGGDSAGEDVATALLGYSKTGQQRRTLITVTPSL